MRWIIVLFIILLLHGCVQKESQTLEEPTNTSKTFLKKVSVDRLDNRSLVLLQYEFPDSGYNIEVLDHSLNGTTLFVYTMMNHSSPAAQVITTINKTIEVEGEVDAVVVITLASKDLLTQQTY